MSEAISLEDWKDMKAEWRKKKKIFYKSHNGKRYCDHWPWRIYTDEEAGVPSSIEAQVKHPYDNEPRTYEVEGIWNICSKCGRVWWRNTYLGQSDPMSGI